MRFLSDNTVQRLDYLNNANCTMVRLTLLFSSFLSLLSRGRAAGFFRADTNHVP